MFANRALLILVGLLVLGQSIPIAATGEEPQKEKRDARQTVEAYLAAVVAGKLKEAALLAEPGKTEGSKKRIEETRSFLNGKVPRIESAHASAKRARALVITEPVKNPKPDPKDLRQGRLIAELSLRGGEWLIRDLDYRSEERAVEVKKSFLRRYPDAKEVPGKRSPR